MRETAQRTVLFAIERLLVRGAHYRFLVVVAAIGVVSVGGGLLLVVGGGGSESTAEAMWWAFLRLSDPGYLGDDEGTWRRIVSTTLTVLGYVIFLGAMVAILTQWLNNTLNRLERGLTPVRMRGHIAILGWTNRTRTICREIVTASGRLDRWLARRGVRRLRIVILAKSVGPERDQELKDTLGMRYRREMLVLRSGSVLRPSHLRRVDVGRAGSIVLPGIEETSSDVSSHDATVIKTLRAISAEYKAGAELPTCVCEIYDPRKIPVAERAYGGPLEVLASDVVIGALLGDVLRQPGLSSVVRELVTHGEGGTLYLRTWSGEPTTVGALRPKTKHAILLGIGTLTEFVLAVDDGTPIKRDDALVYVSTAYELTELGAARTLPPPPTLELPPPERGGGGRVLIVGWSRRVPDLLVELESHPGERWTVDVLSAVDAGTREQELVEHEAGLTRTAVQHLVGDPTLPSVLATIDPAGYDRILFAASDWVETGGESDARTVSAYIALSSVLDGLENRPPIIVELTDSGCAPLFDSGEAEVVVAPTLLSQFLAQVVLRRRLRLVLDDIFGAGTAEMEFRRLAAGPELSFDHVSAAFRAQGSIAIGLRRGGLGGELLLAPQPDEPVDPTRDAVITVRRESAAQT